MRLRVWARVNTGVLCIAVSLALLAASAAAAAPKPIAGKLSKPGYTVIALAANGKATSAVAKRGAFRLRPRAQTVTLHLRAPDGVYAGPVVIRGQRTRAILGVRAGARLGGIDVHPGYARLARRLASRWIDATRVARARKSVPIGAGRFGRVRSRPPRAPVPGDRDRDGIPDQLDIDDDGDLILDDLDRSTAARAAQQVSDNSLLRSDLNLGLSQTANANTPGSTDEQIDAAFLTPGAAQVGIGIPLVPPGASTELDCGGSASPSPPPAWVGGLVYCTRGGTGLLSVCGSCSTREYPECCDADDDGLGALVPPPVVPPNSGAGAMGLVHGATIAQFKTGDVLIKRVSDAGGAEIAALPATLQYVFATVPALVSYSDGQGNSVTVSYPVSPTGPPGAPGEPGNGLPNNGFRVAAGADGDVVVTLTFWRPQRRRIAGDPEPQAGESARWTDIGGLNYSVGFQVLTRVPGGTPTASGSCPQSAFSEDDPNLADPSPPIFGGEAGGFRDLAPDHPASPANTFTYTVNLSRCLESQGARSSFDESGESVSLAFVSSPPSGGSVAEGTAQQTVSFKRR